MNKSKRGKAFLVVLFISIILSVLFYFFGGNIGFDLGNGSSNGSVTTVTSTAPKSQTPTKIIPEDKNKLSDTITIYWDSKRDNVEVVKNEIKQKKNSLTKRIILKTKQMNVTVDMENKLIDFVEKECNLRLDWEEDE